MHTINSSVIEFRVPDTRCIEKQVLDVDNSGGLSSIEFRLSIRDLVRGFECLVLFPWMTDTIAFIQDFTPRIHISEEDFNIMTRGGSLLDENGQLGLVQFEEVMREQIKQFVRRQITNTLIIGPNSVDSEIVQLSTMKAILQEQVSDF